MQGNQLPTPNARGGLRMLTAILAIAALALGGSSALAATESGSNRGLTVTMHAGTHHPKLGHVWPITMTAALNGRAANATVRYQFVYNGSVVGHSTPACPRHPSCSSPRCNPFPFHGSYTDHLTFPACARNVPLTFQLVVSAGGRTVTLSYGVRVI